MMLWMLIKPLVAFSQPSVRVKLTPMEHKRVMGLIDSNRRTLKLTEIEERLQTLENAY